MTKTIDGDNAMHLQQTKAVSRKSGGPQYYLHDVPRDIKERLRKKGAFSVILQTPYGIAASPFMAVSANHKLDARGRIVRGDVGHDRIQQASLATRSIGEEIRNWYGLPAAHDFERIDVGYRSHFDGQLILLPLKAYLRGRSRGLDLECPREPLSLTHEHRSALWHDHLKRIASTKPSLYRWATEQIERVTRQHVNPKTSYVHEADLLRVSGALSILGVTLGPYSVKYYDCSDSSFKFLDYPSYQCPVEIKKDSQGFKYQMERYRPLRRVVVLCVEHNLRSRPDHVDVVELSHMAKYLPSLA